MISDILLNASLYQGAHPGFRRAFAYLASFDPVTPDGNHPLGDGSEARVMTYTTQRASEKRWESHRHHIDVQYVVSGMETMLASPTSALTGATPYDDANDIIFYDAADGAAQTLVVGSGAFTIFYPSDGHLPGIATDRPAGVRKIVIKVPCT